MIKYALSCDRLHAFESWFDSSQSFDMQVKRGFVTCPVCDSPKVSKQIMAPAVRTSKRRPQTEAITPAAEPPAPDAVMATAPEAAELRAMIRALHAHVRANTVDVGDRFADEARKIHAGEADERAIRGQATREEAEALHAEGIAVLPLPPLPDQLN